LKTIFTNFSKTMKTIYIKDGDDIIIDYDCIINISGGFCRITAGKQIINQTGGFWEAWENSSQNVTGQTGGWWRAYNDSSQTVNNQTGGHWNAWDNSSQTITGQSGGMWWAWGNSKQTVI